MGGSAYIPADKHVNIYAGEKLPVAFNGLMAPPALITNSSSYQPFMGKADAYSFRFGKFLVGMNSSVFKTFTLHVPVGFSAAPDVVSGKIYTDTVTLAPLSTAILYLNDYIDTVPVPTTPLLLYINGKVSTTANLVWRPSSGAVSYSLKRSLVKGGPYTAVNTSITDTSFTDASLTRGTTYYYVVSAVNANGESYNSMEVCTAGYKNFAPQITNAITDTAYLGTPYFYTIAAYYSPTAYSANGLPDGLTINPNNGIISGAPISTGVFNIPVMVTNSIGSGSSTFTLVVINPNKPVIISKDTIKAYQGVPFAYQIVATNSPTSFGAYNLSPRLSFDSIKGIISGNLLTTDTGRVNFYAANSGGVDTSLLVIYVVRPPAPVIISPTSVHGVVGHAFGYAISATNSPLFFKAVPLPAGLSIDTTTGVISGLPTTAGSYSVLVYATNIGGTGKATVSFVIPAAPPSPWVDTNINTAKGGYATYEGATGEYTVAGAGNDIGGNADGFNYLYQPITCSTATSIVGRLSSRQIAAGGGGNPGDKVGFMFRESVAANAKHFTIVINSQRVASAMCRTITGGGTAGGIGTAAALDIPVWLRVDRNGNDFTAYASLDSSAWETVGAKTIAMNANMLVGIAVVSRQTTLDISVFDSVSIITDCSVLPLTLVNYQALWQKDKINIGWTVLQAQNNDHFILLRSTDGTSYTEVANIASLGDGTHDYKWIDANPVLGNNYYKLVEVDKDGVIKNMGVRFVRYNRLVGGWSVYPNPTNGRNCFIKCDNAIHSPVTIKLFNDLGIMVWLGNKTVTSNTLPLNFGSNVATGSYWLQIDNNTLLKLVLQ